MLTIQDGVTITINGNGLALVGKGTSTDGIDMSGTSGSVSTLALNDVTVKGGRVGINAGGGAGANNLTSDGGNGGTIILTNSTISDNTGAGVDVNAGSGNFGNFTGGDGGSGGAVALANSTIGGNQGATASRADSAGGNSAFPGNGGAGVGAPAGSGGSFGIDGDGGTFSLTATILANTGANCAGGNTTDTGYNLSTDASCNFGDPTTNGTSSQDNVTSLNLLPLGGYGGLTKTIALGSSSIRTARRSTTRWAIHSPRCREVRRPFSNGYYAVIRFAPEDGQGNNLSSWTLTVTSVELDGPDGQVIPFAHQFQFGRLSGTKGYQLTINTRNLAPGTWTLVVQVGTGASATTGSIGLTVE